MKHYNYLICIALCIALCGCKQPPSPEIDEVLVKKEVNPATPQALMPEATSPQNGVKEQPPIPPKILPIEIFQPHVTWDCEDEEGGLLKDFCYEIVYGTMPANICKNKIDDHGSPVNELKDECELNTPFMAEQDYLKWNLKPGDIITKTGETAQYQIIDGNAEDAIVSFLADGGWTHYFNPCEAFGHEKPNCNMDSKDRIIRLKLLATTTAVDAANNQGQIIPSASASQIPELVPMPVVTTLPEERLTFKKSLKSKKGKVEYLIFHDSQLQTDCYISMLNNQEVLNEMHYCIPFSGVTKELEHPLAATKTARQFDAYPYCINISVEKRNIPGLADFFKAFNPDYYNENLKRFIDNPFQITRPQNSHKKKENCGGRCRPYDVQCVQNYYSKTPAHLCNLAEANRYGQLNSRLDICKLVNPFITFSDYIRYDLRPGDVFLTASAKKGEKALHQYWQVFDMTSLDFQFNGTPETIWELNTCRNTLGEYPEKVVQVRDLSSKDTYEVLYAPIMKGMSARDNYCKAFNNSLINEARTGQYALVESGSPLLKKK